MTTVTTLGNIMFRALTATVTIPGLQAYDENGVRVDFGTPGLVKGELTVTTSPLTIDSRYATAYASRNWNTDRIQRRISGLVSEPIYGGTLEVFLEGDAPNSPSVVVAEGERLVLGSLPDSTVADVAAEAVVPDDDPCLAIARQLPISKIRGLTGWWSPRHCFTDSSGLIRPTDLQEVLRASALVGSTNATATAGNGLTFLTNAINGFPAWQADTNTDLLNAGGSLIGAGYASAMSVFVVVRADKRDATAGSDGRAPVGGAWGSLQQTWNDGSNWKGNTNGTTTGDLVFPDETISPVAVLWFTWDGTTKVLGLNGTYVSSTPGGTFTPAGGFVLGNSAAGASSGFDRPFGDVVVCNAALSIEEAQHAVSLLLAMYGKKKTLTIDGNSLVVGAEMGGSGQSRKLVKGVGARLATVLTDYATVNFGKGGLTTTQMLSDDDDSVHRSGLNLADENIVFFWEGTNEIDASETAANVYANLVAYATDAKAEGFRVVVATVIDRGWGSAPKDLVKDQVNSMIRASGRGVFDAVADLAAMKEFSDSANTTYFNVDGIHLSETGAKVAAGEIARTIRRLERVA